MELLQKECGSGSSLREFRRLVQAIAEEDERYSHLPSYQSRLDEARDMLLARSRGTIAPEPVEGPVEGGHTLGKGGERRE